MTMFERFRPAREAVEFHPGRLPKARVRARIAGLALMGVSIPGNLYYQDVLHNQEVEASSSMSIEVRHEPLDPNNERSAIIAMDGFGTYDADNLARNLGPVAQKLNDGEVWSVSYGNAPLRAKEISQRIVEMARERGRCRRYSSRRRTRYPYKSRR